jgi:YbbR domain-containing protein
MHMLISNLRWKVLALASSFGLWYIFAGQTEVATSLPVTVQYRNVPPDVEISSENVERMFLRLRGPAGRLKASELAQTSVTIDLANTQAVGQQTVTVDERNLGLPAGVRLLRIVPSQIRLTFEKRASREVPVEPRYAGPPPRGYRIVAQSVVPQSLTVVGPESRLSQIESVATDAIDLSSTIGTKEFRVPVFINDPQLRFQLSSPVVVVRVSLEKMRP